jgi:hypothetical protein
MQPDSQSVQKCYQAHTLQVGGLSASLSVYIYIFLMQEGLIYKAEIREMWLVVMISGDMIIFNI